VLKPTMSLISSKEGMLPGGGTWPPLITLSASYKFSEIYIYCLKKETGGN